MGSVIVYWAPVCQCCGRSGSQIGRAETLGRPTSTPNISGSCPASLNKKHIKNIELFIHMFYCRNMAFKQFRSKDEDKNILCIMQHYYRVEP